MIKRTFIHLAFCFLSYVTYGQTLPCGELTKQIQERLLNHSQFLRERYMWFNDSISPYCMGKYFAQKDIDSNIFRVQTFDDIYDEDNLWKVCRYESYGFSLYHQPDFVESDYSKLMDKTKEFADGYNEISIAYLKNKIGDSAFAHIDDIPTDFFNRREFLNQYLLNFNHKEFFNVSVINDTTINVKLKVDSLFKDKQKLIKQVEYLITVDYMDFPRPASQRMTYKEIKETGFRLTEYSKGDYFFEIQFYFRVKPSYWCQTMDIVTYSYILPLSIKQSIK